MGKIMPAYKVDYTWLQTKGDVEKEYDLSDPAMRRLYFNAKIGDEISKLQDFLSRDAFIAYLLAPKMAGKGTYTSMLKEVLGDDLIEHVSIGDVVRKNHLEFEKKGKKSDVYGYVKDNYRGFMSIEQVFDSLVSRDTKSVSIPTEFVLTLIKKEIDSLPNKTIFIDGFPRKADQLSYTLYFRELINHRDDKDFFILINLPVEIINQRIADRTICPKCQTSRNIKLSPTTKVGYDEQCSSFYLVCDNVSCSEVRMVCKEGDELGFENIKDRVIADLDLMDKARNLHGVDIIEIFNAVEKDKANEYVDDYELTKEFCFECDKKGDVSKSTKPFSIVDNDVEYVSLLPAPVVVQLIKQLVYKLGL